jgi:hypothetical protein
VGLPITCPIFNEADYQALGGLKQICGGVRSISLMGDKQGSGNSLIIFSVDEAGLKQGKMVRQMLIPPLAESISFFDKTLFTNASRLARIACVS